MLSRTFPAVIATSLLLPLPANGEQDPVPSSKPASETPEDDSLGLSFGLSWLSAYNFRGLNLFQSKSQTDQNMLLAPTIAWDIAHTGLAFGYWGGYQISGENIGELIDAGVGAEQDLSLAYTWDITDWASLTSTLMFYLYPFADEAVAGTRFPAYIDPTVDLALLWAVDFGMKVTYYAGLQRETNAFNHLYLSPSVSRSFALSKRVSFDALFSVGYKVWQDRSLSDNTWDVLLDASLPISVTDRLTVTPRFQAAWTNLEDKRRLVLDSSHPADPVVVAGTQRQEGFAVGGLDISLSL